MSLLELDLGVRLYVRPLDSPVSGLFAYDDGVGACILLNASHRPARQAQTAVHELGHLTSCRQTPVLGRTATVDYGGGDAQRPVSLRLGLLAAEAERRELLSEGQLARLLCLDRVELRRILDAAGRDEDDADGPPKLPR
ncbi:MAG: ImmA/IrrE family metallo-endopeptidase [Acidobacteria bacterium]|nr:ImmA/IrrE family metallo-endopeptidase [Acidobacteriota bacterium]